MDPADPTTPPPPRLPEFLSGTIVVFDDRASADDAASAVRDRSANEPYVLAPDEVVILDAARDHEAGLATRAYRFLSSFVSDQNTLQARYVDLARQGGWIMVAVARDDAQAEDLWHDLKARGAHDGIHVAGMTLRELV